MDDAHFFQKMTDLLMEEPHQTGYLVTLCDYVRSSPQPKGALWFYHPRTQLGSLSSGCLERILVGLFEKNAFQSFPFFLHIYQKNTRDLETSTSTAQNFYSEKKTSDAFWYQSSLPFLSLEDFLTQNVQYSFLPCQGSLVLLIEKIEYQPPSTDGLFSFYQKLAQDLADQKKTLKKISFIPNHNTKNTYKTIFTNEIIDTSETIHTSKIIEKPESTGIPHISLKKEIVEIKGAEQHINYIHRFDIRYPLVLIGWNAVALYLAQFASSLQFDVFVCEPRFQPHDLPSGVTWSAQVPDIYLQNHFQSQPYAIIALSHEAALDDIALLEAIDSHAYYIGALGSKRTAQKRIDRLLSLGLDSHQVQRIRSPVGLDLKSKWPAEIAISILAELIMIRNQ